MSFAECPRQQVTHSDPSRDLAVNHNDVDWSRRAKSGYKGQHHDFPCCAPAKSRHHAVNTRRRKRSVRGRARCKTRRQEELVRRQSVTRDAKERMQ